MLTGFRKINEIDIGYKFWDFKNLETIPGMMFGVPLGNALGKCTSRLNVLLHAKKVH